MIELLIALAIMNGTLMNSITLLIIVKVAMPKKSPMDVSNRINHIRLIWWAITKPEMFAKWFEWTQKDEGDNLK